MHCQKIDERGTSRGCGRQVAVRLDEGPSVSLQLGEADVTVERERAVVVREDEGRAWMRGDRKEVRMESGRGTRE